MMLTAVNPYLVIHTRLAWDRKWSITFDKCVTRIYMYFHKCIGTTCLITVTCMYMFSGLTFWYWITSVFSLLGKTTFPILWLPITYCLVLRTPELSPILQYVYWCCICSGLVLAAILVKFHGYGFWLSYKT